jgi:hypothetical protein
MASSLQVIPQDGLRQVSCEYQDARPLKIQQYDAPREPSIQLKSGSRPTNRVRAEVVVLDLSSLPHQRSVQMKRSHGHSRDVSWLVGFIRE